MRGRKQRIGGLVFNKEGQMRFCGGYCDEGHKAFLTREEMERLRAAITKKRGSITYRLMKRYVDSHTV